MKLQNYLKKCFSGILAASIGIMTFSCQQDSLILSGDDCSVLSMSIISGTDTFYVKTYPDSLVAVVDVNTDMNNVDVALQLSEGAVMTPSAESVSDWTQPYTFTVTSANGKSVKEYSYHFRREAITSYCRDNVYLKTQSEVNEFGAKGYVRVRSIVVNESEKGGITDLSPLASIEAIDNNLTVKGYSGEELILDNLVKVASFDIRVPSIVTISMKNLTDINNLYIGQINEEFTMADSSIDSLANIDFSSLEHIKGSLILSFFNFAQGYAISGFDNLSQVDGDILLNLNTEHLKTFSNLKKIRGIQMGGTIKSFEGFENIEEVTGTFITNYLRGSASLLPFAPKKMHSIILRGSQTLESLDFLKNLTELYDLEISGGFKFKTLSGMESLKTITHGLFIKQTQIANLDELSGLESVGSVIKFTNNNRLADFSGIKNCLKNFDGEWIVENNKVNPTIDDILNQ